MICHPCRQGAAYNKAWRAAQWRRKCLSFAQASHNECKGCSCQHAIGADSLVVTPL